MVHLRIGHAQMHMPEGHTGLIVRRELGLCRLHECQGDP